MNRPIRVLYSFPHKLGADRICTTAGHQVDGVAAAGAEVLVHTGAVTRSVRSGVQVRTTLARGRLRLPYRLLGSARSCLLHDWLVARQLKRLAGSIDIVHAWPAGALRTLKVARELGLPTVLERPNAHTEYAYDVVEKECQKLGVSMPPGHEHAYNAKGLAHEKLEYQAAFRLLCPSDFVARTFTMKGFPQRQLLRHQYGFDDQVFRPDPARSADPDKFVMIFVGGCAPRKGLHYALEAWLRSPAHKRGQFLIVGGFIPGYRERLGEMLAHPSIKVLGHRRDIPELMRQADALVLPSIEEGSALVTSEARGCGCVLLVSDAAGAICQHGENGLIHPAGDVDALTQHLSLLAGDRAVLERLRTTSLQSVSDITWRAAGKRLLAAYQEAITDWRARS